MNENELYECHNKNKDDKICGYRGYDINAKTCPMCGKNLAFTDWFKRKREVD